MPAADKKLTPPASSILWIVTARAGSKGIPGKNIRPLGEHPLLAYRIASVLCFADPKDVWMSTDSQAYADLAQSYGATVPFLRPAHLAADTSSSIDVVVHAMEHAESLGRTYQVVGLLEPTSPFVTPETLARAAAVFDDRPEVEAIVATREVRPATFFVQKQSEFLEELAHRMEGVRGTRRQDLEPEITLSGGFYLSRWNSFLNQRSFVVPRTLSFPVREEESLEIDEPIDWDWANFLLTSGRVNPAEYGLS